MEKIIAELLLFSKLTSAKISSYLYSMYIYATRWYNSSANEQTQTEGGGVTDEFLVLAYGIEHDNQYRKIMYSKKYSIIWRYNSIWKRLIYLAFHV